MENETDMTMEKACTAWRVIENQVGFLVVEKSRIIFVLDNTQPKGGCNLTPRWDPKILK